MTTYDALSRHSTAPMLKVAALMFLGALLQLLALPCAITTLLVDRLVTTIAEQVAQVPVDTPLTSTFIAARTRERYPR